jgi:hypothetical protein
MRSSAPLGKINPFEGLIEIHTSAPRPSPLIPTRFRMRCGQDMLDHPATAADRPRDLAAVTIEPKVSTYFEVGGQVRVSDGPFPCSE